MSDLSHVRRVVACSQFFIDPAVDVKASNPIAYALTRDEVHLAYREGHKPTYFVLTPLKRKFVTHVLDGEKTEAAKYERAFRASCHRIELPDGGVLEARTVDVPHEGTLATEEWVDDVVTRFGGHVVDEMGEIAWEAYKLPPKAEGPFGLRRGWEASL